MPSQKGKPAVVRAWGLKLKGGNLLVDGIRSSKLEVIAGCNPRDCEKVVRVEIREVRA